MLLRPAAAPNSRRLLVSRVRGRLGRILLGRRIARRCRGWRSRIPLGCDLLRRLAEYDGQSDQGECGAGRGDAKEELALCGTHVSPRSRLFLFFLEFGLGDDLLLHVGRHHVVMTELH